MSEQKPNNFFSFLSNIPKFLANPFGKNEKGQTETSQKIVDEGEITTKTPDVVRFPLIQTDISPLKLENEDAQDTNPFVLWQVYALGGIIVLRWAWAKWQERKANAKSDSSDADQLPPSARPKDPSEGPTHVDD